jgi:broad specificity phosphatase PhoE
MVKFIIVRHGESTCNQSKTYTGQTESPLTELGILQAKITGEYLYQNYKIDLVYSSDLSRAIDTAKAFTEKTGQQVIADKNLREFDLGLWAGKTFEEVDKLFPKTAKLFKKDLANSYADGGESYAQFQSRVKKAFEEIASKNDGKTVAVFTHGGVVRALYSAWNNFSADQVNSSPKFSNSSITVVEYSNGKPIFNLINYDKHLGELATQFVNP